jgi:succinate dehydrogenase / fumarate reductase cytochrome b subunit
VPCFIVRVMASRTEPYQPSLAATDGRSAPIRSIRRSYFSTSVGTKVLIAATGLLLFLYLILHLVGNLLVFAGPRVFNGYSSFLISNPLIVPVEIGLAAIFVIHVYKAIANWYNNRRARPVGYYQSEQRIFGYGWAGRPSRKSIASSTMIWTGLITLLFVFVHVRQFRFGAEYHVLGQAQMKDLYRLEVENFSSIFNVLFYVFATTVVSFHLWHGLSSAFQSLGVSYPWATPIVLRVGKVLAFVIGLGFFVIPIWVFLFGGR